MESTSTMSKNGEAAWWLTVYKTAVAGIRAVGLPSKSSGALAIKVPTLKDQADSLRKKVGP